MLPPLRERVEDIPAVGVTHLLQRINEKVHRHVTRVPKDVLLRHLTSLPWTGNVRASSRTS